MLCVALWASSSIENIQREFRSKNRRIKCVFQGKSLRVRENLDLDANLCRCESLHVGIRSTGQGQQVGTAAAEEASAAAQEDRQEFVGGGRCMRRCGVCGGVRGVCCWGGGV
jgi:hypothetical protein